MNDFEEWARQYPQAAGALQRVIGAVPWPNATRAPDHSEAWAQQRDRFTIAHAGGLAWRNNVGATPAKCPDCGAKQRPVRYGLANDSQQLNEVVKSADLIGIIPRLISPAMVGQTIGQFASIESKPPGWHYTATGREPAQAEWASIVRAKHGFAAFSTGDLTL